MAALTISSGSSGRSETTSSAEPPSSSRSAATFFEPARRMPIFKRSNNGLGIGISREIDREREGGREKKLPTMRLLIDGISGM